ncbi:hemagglutinin repeat-containing protein [Pseudoxanthomonas beigongshangi]
MNHIYRLVFNRTLRVWQVASELVRNACGQPATGKGGRRTAALPALRFALWCALGWVTAMPSLSVQAQQAPDGGRIVADPGAPGRQRPTVTQAPNGVPLVNITTPSAAGVSRNTYSQFDVGAQGAILNNARTQAQTQLGGRVQGNPWLATGTARIILNEVNSAHPSQLRGYLEIAGDRAQLIIANPAGIQIAGGGFLNASRATLTTGQPVFNGGALDHYRVDGGVIRVEGAGLDATQVDYTDLIARSMEINGGLWAQQLQASLGTNRVAADHARLDTLAEAGGNNRPAFALDVGALGGMYANKIFLVGTEQGVGVRNAGAIGAQAGELVVTLEGRLENRGKLQARTDTRIAARDGVANAGLISASRSLVLDMAADLDNRGVLNAGRVDVAAESMRNRGGAIEQTGWQALALETGLLSNREGGRIGIAPDPETGGGESGSGNDDSSGNGGGSDNGGHSGDGGGKGEGGGNGGENPQRPDPMPEGRLRIAGTLDNDGGVINAGGGVSLLTVHGLDNSGGRLGLRGLTLERGLLGNAGGELDVSGDVRLHLDRFVNDAGRFAVGGSLQLDARQASNRGGQLTQGGNGASVFRVAGTFDNRDGTIGSNAAQLTLDAGTLLNARGRIEHAGADGLALRAGAWQGAEGVIATVSKAEVDAGQIDHRGATLSARQLDLRASGFDNRAGQVLLAGSAANILAVGGRLDNGTQGTLASQGDLRIRAGSFGNAGGTVQQAGDGGLDIASGDIDGRGGTLASNGGMRITGERVDLRDGTTFARALTIDSGVLVTAGGTLTSAGPEALAITARERLDNTGGTIASNGVLALQAGTLVNREGVLTAAGDAATDVRVARDWDNTGGRLTAAGAVRLRAGGLDNREGMIQAAGDAGLDLRIEDRLSNAKGRIESNGDLTLVAGSLDNIDGNVQSTRDVRADIRDTFDNTRGAVVAGNDLALATRELLNRDTRPPARTEPTAQAGLLGSRVTLHAERIDNRGGQIHAATSLVLEGRDRSGTVLDNAGGVIDATGNVDITAARLGNAGGSLVQRGGQARLSVAVEGGLDNTDAGLIGAEGDADLALGALDNAGGTIFSRRDLAIAARGDASNRDGGLIQSNGRLAFSAGGSLDNAQGVIDAADFAILAATRIRNTGGQLLAGGVADGTALTLTTAALDNRGGTIGTRDGDAVIHADAIDNQDGTLVAQRDLRFDTRHLDNTGGSVFATRHLRYRNNEGTLDNTRGQFGAGDTAWVELARVDNRQGGRLQAGTVWLTTPRLDIEGGEVAANILHADLAGLTGLGRLHGVQWLDVDIHGDFTYADGQRFESDGLLDLTVTGTLTHQGTLQTAGELAIAAAHLTHQGVINASNTEGTGLARINVAGVLDNQRGARLEGDTVVVAARDLTNTGNIVGDTVGIEADTLTNGRDLGARQAAVDYGEGFIGAATSLDLRIAQRLSNLDGELFSGGDLRITGRAEDSRVAVLENVSGRIQAEGDMRIAADRLDNRRRMIEVETYTLTPEEQYAWGSQRRFDEAWATLTDVERARLQYLNDRPAAQLTGGEIAEKQALNQKVGWHDVDHVSDEMLAAINDWYHRIGAPGYGAWGGYIIDNAGTPDDNPGAQIIQRDRYLTGQRLVESGTSAASRIAAGGNLELDAGRRIRNHASRIAAGGWLQIAGQDYDGSQGGSDARIENIAVAGQLTGTRETQAWVYPEIRAMYQNGKGWHETLAEVIGFLYEDITATGPVLASASITAGKGLHIEAGDVTNTAVLADAGLSDFTGGALAGPGNIGLGAATGIPNAAGPRGPEGMSGQVVGTPEHPLPGLVPSDNGMFDLHADADSPFLVTTAPRFAKGDGTGSDYLLGRLGWRDPHKRLGDAYYEQRLVLEQILSLTGRRALDGNADGFAQYRALMDNAATEAGRLGLALGAPLSSTQIGALDRDIVWLVEQEVNGQKVLVPVVYLSRATAARMQAEGTLMAGDTVDVRSTGTVRNDGTLDGARGAWLSADALINDGAIHSRAIVDISTRGDVFNRGRIAGERIGVEAGGDIVNTVRFGEAVGTMDAGAGGMALRAGRDIVNQGNLASKGNAILDAGRDVVQNAATGQSGAGLGRIQAGRLASDASAVISAGRDAVFDQSDVRAEQHLVIDAGRDARFVAADMQAGRTLAVTAGRDLVSEAVTTTSQRGLETRERGRYAYTVETEQITRGSSFQAGGDLALKAGQDIRLTAVEATAGGDMALSAGRDLISETGTNTLTRETDEYRRQGKTRTRTRATTVDEALVGNNFSAGGDLAMVSGRDLTLSAATVHSKEGGIALAAGRDLVLDAAQENHGAVVDSVSRRKGTLSKTVTTTHDEVSDSYAIGTTLSGDRVDLSAGNDMTLRAATVAGDRGVTATAGGNIVLETGVNTHTQSSRSDKKKSGLFGGGGLGFTLGTRKTGNTLDVKETTHTGTLLGSSQGRVDIVAGKDVTLTGSDVLADAGILISGENVTLQHAENTLDVRQTRYTRQSGLNVSLKGGVADVATTVYDSAKRAGEVEDDRLKGLHAAKAGQALFSKAAGGAQGSGISQLGNVNGQFNDLANTARTGEKQGDGGLSLRIGFGASSSRSEYTLHETSAHGSTVRSNGDVAIVAREGDLTITGSRVEGENVGLAAKRDILLQSAKETSEQRERSKSSSGEVGFTVGSEAGLGIYLSASASRGRGNGSSVHHKETVIRGKQGVSFVSGGNTTLEGAQIIGERVVGQVGGNLTIRSQQDSEQYQRKDQSAGVDAAFGTGGGSFSANYAQSKINSNYTSVREQSGIQAGAGGFQLDVKGHTQLDGGAIASTATADRNVLRTGSLGYTDLHNHAEYKAESFSASGGTSGGGPSPGGGKNPWSGGLSPGLPVSQQDSISSTTRAGIAEGTLIVADGSGTGIARGVSELQQDGLKTLFDEQKVRERLEMGQVAGEVGFRAAGDIAQAMTREHDRAQLQARAAEAVLNNPNATPEDRVHARQLLEQANSVLTATQSQYALWKDGGTGKTLLHAVTGALVAGMGGGDALQGALGAGVAELGRPLTADESNLVKQLLSLGLGALTGGRSGAATALDGEKFNRQLHPKEIDWIDANAAAFAAQEYGCAIGCSAEQIAAAKQRLMVQAVRQVDARWNEMLGYGGLFAQDGNAQSFLSAQTIVNGRDGFAYFAADRGQYNDSSLFADKLRGTQALSQLYTAVLNTAKDQTQARHLLQALNRTDAGWRDDFVGGVMGNDAWTVFTMFTGDVGFVADITHKLLTGDEEGAARDLMTAIITARVGAALGGLAQKLKGPLDTLVDSQMDALAQRALLRSGGMHGLDGQALLDFKVLTNDQKRVIGEMFGDNAVRTLLPDGRQLARSQGAGTNGIDDLFKVNRPDVDYVNIEYKFVGDYNKTGASRLDKTADGLQGSEQWIGGSARLERALGGRAADEVRQAIRKNRFESWVVTVRPDGSTEIQVLDAAGKSKPVDTSRLLFPKSIQ